MTFEPDDHSTMEQQLLVAVTRLEAKIDTLLIQQSDHENRLRALEAKSTVSPKQLWTTLVSAISVLVPLLTFILTVL